MKRISILAAAVVACGLSLAVALDDQVLPPDGSFYDGARFQHSFDTAEYTEPTQYTPKRIGDILVGGAGPGTNAAWIAKGVTSNDWFTSTSDGLPTAIGSTVQAYSAELDALALKNARAQTNLLATAIAIGNIAVARITNAAATVGASIGGNIPVAAITNAATTLGPSIGGNIAIGTLTNALGGVVGVTNTIADVTTTRTNTIVVINGVITSWTISAAP